MFYDESVVAQNFSAETNYNYETFQQRFEPMASGTWSRCADLYNCDVSSLATRGLHCVGCSFIGWNRY